MIKFEITQAEIDKLSTILPKLDIVLDAMEDSPDVQLVVKTDDSVAYPAEEKK